MAPALLRFFVRCLLWSLGALPAIGGLALLISLLKNEVFTLFATLLGWLLWLVFFFGTLLSLLLLSAYGLAALLLWLAGRLPSQIPDAAAAPVPAYALLGQFLTRYHLKHAPDTSPGALTVHLLDFERALGVYLPEAARLHSAWWTAASEHTQQWHRDGWHVTGVSLVAQQPSVTFSPVVSAPAACLPLLA
jgi:hypothetical protein